MNKIVSTKIVSRGVENGGAATSRVMNRAAIAALLVGAAVSLSGCYVVPVQGEAGRPVYAYVPAAEASRIVAPAPVPAAIPLQPQLPQQAGVTTFSVRLYPMNDAAAQTGAIQGVVTDNMAGRGIFTLTSNGEQLQGEATRVPDGYPGFGQVMTSVMGAAPAQVRGGQKGIANAYGSRGVYANCEYILSARSVGTGACLFSSGAKYRVHFGG